MQIDNIWKVSAIQGKKDGSQHDRGVNDGSASATENSAADGPAAGHSAYRMAARQTLATTGRPLLRRGFRGSQRG